MDSTLTLYCTEGEAILQNWPQVLPRQVVENIRSTTSECGCREDWIYHEDIWYIRQYTCDGGQWISKRYDPQSDTLQAIDLPYDDAQRMSERLGLGSSWVQELTEGLLVDVEDQPVTRTFYYQGENDRTDRESSATNETDIH